MVGMMGSREPNPLTMKSWSPYVVGAGIGVTSWFAFVTVDHPLDITTPFEHTAALIAEGIFPQIARTNEYYQQASPRIGWEWMLVLGIFLGARLSAHLSGDRNEPELPRLWTWRFGKGKPKRVTTAFLGAALMMFGARMAYGFAAGDGISGNLQLEVSAWLFSVLFFAVAVGTAFLIYGREGAHHV